MENGVKRDITRIYNWQEDILLRILACDELTPFGPCDRDCLLSILIVVLGCKKRGKYITAVLIGVLALE